MSTFWTVFCECEQKQCFTRFLQCLSAVSRLEFPHFMKGVCTLIFVCFFVSVNRLCKGFMAFIRNKVSSGTIW